MGCTGQVTPPLTARKWGVGIAPCWGHGGDGGCDSLQAVSPEGWQEWPSQGSGEDSSAFSHFCAPLLYHFLGLPIQPSGTLLWGTLGLPGLSDREVILLSLDFQVRSFLPCSNLASSFLPDPPLETQGPFPGH